MKKRISTLFYLLLAIVLQLSLVFPQTDWSQVVLPNGRSIQVKMDHRRAAPQRLTGLDINFGQYGVVNRANLPALGRRFLGDHAALLQINTESLAIKNVKSRKGRWYVVYNQEVEGIRVHRSRIGFTVSSNGAVSVINSDYYPNIDIDLIPGITADRALEIAQTDFLALSSADTVRIKKDPELIVLPVEGDNSYSYVLAYNLALAFKGLQAVFNETYFVDATTGDVIERYSNLKSGTLNGTISYNYWPEHDYDTQQSSPYKTGTVDLTLLTGWVARTTTSSSAGYYNFANISIQPYYIYPRFNNSYVKIINEGPTASNQRTPTSSYS